MRKSRWSLVSLTGLVVLLAASRIAAAGEGRGDARSTPEARPGSSASVRSPTRPPP